MTGPVHSRARTIVRVPSAGATILIAVLIGAAWVMAESPALVGFGIAVAAAFWWCFWLEQHTDTTDRRPIPTPGGGTRLGLPHAPEASEPVSCAKAA